MNNWRLGEVEAQFADLIWANAPISSGELAKLALARIGWKKTTSYTVLKRLCDRGIFQNDCGLVRVTLSRDDFYTEQSHIFVKESFGGSLPAFFKAYGRNAKLNRSEVEELLNCIEKMRR